MFIEERDVEWEFSRSRCNPSARSIHCIVHLKKDISQVIPYLNAELGGDACSQDPPFVTFKIMGRLLTVHPDRIAINAMEDMEQGKKVMRWIIGEINRIWEERDRIVPTYRVPPRPQPFEILKLLPRTNCGRCGLPTCMVFATQMAQGVRGAEECVEMDPKARERLEEYLSRFSLTRPDLSS